MASANPLAFLVGPTASGKSALALEIAGRVGAEIVSVDSMQVYRGMDIGTAKPSAAEQAQVRHHLLDRADPSERYDVQRFLADVDTALSGIAQRGARPLFVGGTGFYIKALTHGLFEGPSVDPDLRAALEERARSAGPDALHAELTQRDPKSAERLHPNDVRRVVRALEVLEQTGRPLSDWQREWDKSAPGRPRRIVGLSIELADLEPILRRRTRAMLAAGWIEEVRAVRDGAGFGPTAVQALGYPEILRYLEQPEGEAQSLAELEDEIVLRTRQFARRQFTWYRRFSEIEWIPAPRNESERPSCVDRALAVFGW